MCNNSKIQLLNFQLANTTTIDNFMTTVNSPKMPQACQLFVLSFLFILYSSPYGSEANASLQLGSESVTIPQATSLILLRVATKEVQFIKMFLFLFYPKMMPIMLFFLFNYGTGEQPSLSFLFVCSFTSTHRLPKSHPSLVYVPVHHLFAY